MLIPYGNTHFSLDVEADLLLPRADLPHCAAGFRLGSSDHVSRIARAGSVTLVVPDHTRPAAHRRILPALTPLLQGKERLTVVVATGAHATPSPDYLAELGALVPFAEIVVHDCDLSDMVFLGVTGRGTPVSVNRALRACDLLVGMGSVTIHPFAGLSGGPKHFVPGCAARETITANHRLLLAPEAEPGRLDDNPLYLDLLEAVVLLGNPLIINEALAPDSTPLGYFMGPVASAHKAAAELALQAAAIPIRDPYDLVIASAGGAPRDVNLYQGIKALEMATLACRAGGKLVLLAQCPEGVGSHLYEQWAQRSKDEQEAMVRTSFTVGAHKAFLASRALAKLGGAVLISELPPRLVSAMGFTPAASLAEALRVIDAPRGTRIGVMPHATASLPTSQS